MSLLKTVSLEISSRFHRKCIPLDYDINSSVIMERHWCFCHDSFPYSYKYAIVGYGKSAFRCPVKETVEVTKCKLKGYNMFDCRHWITWTELKSERIPFLE